MRMGWVSEKLKHFHYSGQKSVALLIDPDAVTHEDLFQDLISLAIKAHVDFFLSAAAWPTLNSVDGA